MWTYSLKKIKIRQFNILVNLCVTKTEAHYLFVEYLVISRHPEKQGCVEPPKPLLCCLYYFRLAAIFASMKSSVAQVPDVIRHFEVSNKPSYICCTFCCSPQEYS